jgi:hypothetical protein
LFACGRASKDSGTLVKESTMSRNAVWNDTGDATKGRFRIAREFEVSVKWERERWVRTWLASELGVMEVRRRGRWRKSSWIPSFRLSDLSIRLTFCERPVGFSETHRLNTS